MERERLQRNEEGGVPGEPREITSAEIELNEETPLTGREFLRKRHGTYVEIPE
jgi:hypothetical protein